MSEYKWCHGPKCHKSHTQDRIRGSKGSKVLRTKKVKTTEWNRTNGYQYFCSTGCWNDFFIKYAQQCVAIAPRHEPLETPIEDPKKVTHQSQYNSDYSYTTTEIKERVDTSMEQDYKGYRKDIYMTQPKTKIIQHKDESPSLSDAQKFVGGWVEVVQVNDGILIIDEEGKLKDKPINNASSKLYADKYGDADIIVGDAIYIPKDVPSEWHG